MNLAKIHQISKQDNHSKQTLCQHRGLYDLPWFAQTFFPGHCKTSFSSMHQELFNLYPVGKRGQNVMIAAPRGHAKTTIMLLIHTIHAIVYGYEPFVVIVAQSQQEAESRVEQILDELRHNERLINVFGNLAPDKGKGGKRKFTTKNGVMIRAISRGQQIRGLNIKGNRPSLIIMDDIETLEGVQTPEQRQKTRDWFYKDIVPAGQTDGTTNFILIGTCLHEESLVSELLAAPHCDSKKYQAIVSFASNQALWDEWQRLYTNLQDPNREATALAFYQENQTAMLVGAEVLWPEVEPYYDLMKKYVQIGRKAFYSEKQNEPFDPSSQLFNMDAALYFSIDYRTQLLTCPERQIEIRREDLYNVIAYHDPAMGDSEGDYAAIVVVGKDRNGYYYVLDAYIGREYPDQQIEAAFNLYRKWQYSRIIVESNGFQMLVRDNYNKRFENEADSPLVQSSNNSENKIERIATLQPHITNGHLLFNETLPVEFIRQLHHFPSATHDDGPDALNGAVNALSRSVHPDDLRRRDRPSESAPPQHFPDSEDNNQPVSDPRAINRPDSLNRSDWRNINPKDRVITDADRRRANRPK